MAAAAIALTAAILYTYYESGRSKTSVEDRLNDQMVIEPYEVNEIRFLNNLTPTVYDALAVACMNNFSSSPTTQQGEMTSFDSSFPKMHLPHRQSIKNCFHFSYSLRYSSTFSDLSVMLLLRQSESQLFII